MRGEKKCGRAVAEDLRFEELPEGCCGEGVETARGFVEKEDARGVQESASEAQALNGAGRERADLAIESFGEFELSGELDDSIASFGRREMVQAAEEEKIFAAGKAEIKTLVAPGVVAELAADGARSGD